MGEFIMKVESEDKKESMMTGECETTMVPKFQIDFKNKTLNYLNKTKFPKYNIYLLNKKKEEIHKFEVDLGRLSFFGKELRNVCIYHYPIIIFEFMTGYFTTEELYNKNRELSLEFTKDFEIMEKPNLLKINQSKSSNAESIAVKEQKNEENKNIIEKIDAKNSVSVNANNEILNQKNEKEILSKSVMPAKKLQTQNQTSKKKIIFEKKGQETTFKQIKCTKYSDYIKNFQMLLYLINPQENIKETNPNFGSELEVFNENLEKYKRKLRIMQMEKEIEFLKKKNEAIKELNKDLEEAIKNKNDNLEKVTAQIKPNQVNYNNKLTQLKSNLNCRGQHQLIYDSFVYQKMAEICFVFFNNKIQSLYTIPPFYNLPIDINDQKKMERLDYYNKDKKNISAMMGHICQL
jgi:cephalosporin hydroxylase